MSQSLFGESPFQRMPNLTKPQAGVDMTSHSLPSDMPHSTQNSHAFGPTPHVSPTPSRAGSARHIIVSVYQCLDVTARVVKYAWMALAPPEPNGLEVGAERLLPAFRGVPRAVQAQLELTKHLPVHVVLLW